MFCNDDVMVLEDKIKMLQKENDRLCDEVAQNDGKFYFDQNCIQTFSSAPMSKNVAAFYFF